MAAATPYADLYGTGIAADGFSLLAGGAVDPHWSLVSAPAGSGLGPSAFVAQDTFPYPFPNAWVANGFQSQWIAPAADQSGAMPTGDYDYRTTFNVDDIAPLTFAFAGSWAVDDSAYMLINGQPIGITNSGANQLSQFFLVDSAAVVNGVNTLDIIVTNGRGTDLNASGLQIRIQANQAPEPSTLVLAALGGLALLVYRRRK
ncbi:MAG TPA: PEP-CTERM sorting domain-containing protein [Pirellulales bacterium]|jgi:hypothetical protein